MTHQSKYTCEKSASKNGAFKSRLGFLLAIPALLAPVSILLLSGGQESLSSSRRLLASKVTVVGMEPRQVISLCDLSGIYNNIKAGVYGFNKPENLDELIAQRKARGAGVQELIRANEARIRANSGQGTMKHQARPRAKGNGGALRCSMFSWNVNEKCYLAQNFLDLIKEDTKVKQSEVYSISLQELGLRDCHKNIRAQLDETLAGYTCIFDHNAGSERFKRNFALLVYTKTVFSGVEVSGKPIDCFTKYGAKGMVGVILSYQGYHFGISSIHMNDTKNKSTDPEKSVKAATKTLSKWKKLLDVVQTEAANRNLGQIDWFFIGDHNPRTLSLKSAMAPNDIVRGVDEGTIPWTGKAKFTGEPNTYMDPSNAGKVLNNLIRINVSRQYRDVTFINQLNDYYGRLRTADSHHYTMTKIRTDKEQFPMVISVDESPINFPPTYTFGENGEYKKDPKHKVFFKPSLADRAIRITVKGKESDDDNITDNNSGVWFIDQNAHENPFDCGYGSQAIKVWSQQDAHNLNVGRDLKELPPLVVGNEASDHRPIWLRATLTVRGRRRRRVMERLVESEAGNI